MAKYRILTTGPIVIDGQSLPAGKTVAIIETELPLGNVLSSACFGHLANEKIPDAAVVAVVARAPELVEGAPITKPATPDVDAIDPDDPDALNEADLAEEAEEAAAKQAEPETDAPAAPAAEKAAIDPSLDGLTERVQRVLTREGLGTRDKIAEFVARGDKLADKEGIGPSAELKILAWLDN